MVNHQVAENPAVMELENLEPGDAATIGSILAQQESDFWEALSEDEKRAQAIGEVLANEGFVLDEADVKAVHDQIFGREGRILDEHRIGAGTYRKFIPEMENGINRHNSRLAVLERIRKELSSGDSFTGIDQKVVTLTKRNKMLMLIAIEYDLKLKVPGVVL